MKIFEVSDKKPWVGEDLKRMWGVIILCSTAFTCFHGGCVARSRATACTCLQYLIASYSILPPCGALPVTVPVQALTLLTDDRDGFTVQSHTELLERCLPGQAVLQKDSKQGWAVVISNANYTPATLASGSLNHWSPAWKLDELCERERAAAAWLL